MRIKLFSGFLFLASFILPTQLSAATIVLPGADYYIVDSSKVDEFRQDIIDEFTPLIGADKAKRIFSDPRLQLDGRVIRRAVAPGTKPFSYFGPSFGLLTPAAIAKGKAYKETHAVDLAGEEKEYGVDQDVILGILRIETYFGNAVSRLPVMNALWSMYSLTPKRQNFAVHELYYFLDFAEEHNIDPYSVGGSVAGAIGIPQFLPSSYASFAVDGNDDGNFDLFNHTDAIYSIGNYLKEHGFGPTLKAKRSAVYAYNHDIGYVNAVMAFANAMKPKPAVPPKKGAAVP